MNPQDRFILRLDGWYRGASGNALTSLYENNSYQNEFEQGYALGRLARSEAMTRIRRDVGLPPAKPVIEQLTPNTNQLIERMTI